MLNDENMPLVSIITPCYNSEKYLDEYLESIYKQTYKSLELLVINDGSTDNSVTIIEKWFEKLKSRQINCHLINQDNNGQASAINQGLSRCVGKYFIWPDSDDYLTPYSIESRVKFLEDNPTYRFCRSNGRYFSDKGMKELVFAEGDEIKEDLFENLYMERVVCNPGAFMMSRELFLECYPENQIYAGIGSQNWQILVPAASKSKCGYVDEVLYYIRIHSDSFCRKKRTFVEWIERMDDHNMILNESFKHSKCDYEKCVYLINERYIRKRIDYAIKYNEQEYLEKYYINLMECNYLVPKDKVIRIASKNRTFLQFLRVHQIILRVLNKLRRLLLNEK